MDQKQFGRLQQAVQDAVDDHRRQMQGAPVTHHTWNQGSWFSGTELGASTTAKAKNGRVKSVFTVPVTCSSTACVAGNGVINAGDLLVITQKDLRETEWNPGQTVEVDQCVDLHGRLHSIEKRAAQLFGITQEEADYLFYGGNSIEAVEQHASRITGMYGFTLTIDHDKPINKKVYA